MRGMNQMIVVGNLGGEVELKTSKDGRPWAQLSVATARTRKEGDAWVEATDWHRVRVFGPDAERCAKFLGKGSLIGVEGSVAYQRWTDEHGVKHNRAVILADSVQFLGGVARPSRSEPEVAAHGSEEIPF